MRTKAAVQLLLLLVLLSVNYFLLHRFLNSPETHLKDSNSSHLVQTFKHREEYCIAYNVTKGKKSFREGDMEPITLAVHTTSAYLNYIFEQVDTWDGSISVALFVDRWSQSSVEFLYSIWRCNEVFAEKISLHIVFRLSAFYSACPLLTISPKECSTINYNYMNAFINRLMPPFTIYPINIMRNVARKGASSHFHLVADIEMIFSQDFAQIARKLANKNLCQECGKLIVVRRFEVDDEVKNVPKTVEALKKQVDDRLAFEFHHKLFPSGHTIEGLWHWFRESKPFKDPTVWEIPYKGQAWEPQVIVHSSVLYMEENVPTRWRDQQTLIYELCRANFTFLLASHIFNVHRGIKKEPTPLDKAVKNHQSQLRSRYFRNYMIRINSIYENSTRCGKFTM